MIGNQREEMLTRQVRNIKLEKCHSALDSSSFCTRLVRQLVDWLCGGKTNAAGKLKAGTLTPSKNRKIVGGGVSLVTAERGQGVCGSPGK